MSPLSQSDSQMLASAYELRRSDVEQDARLLVEWTGSHADLLRQFEERHRWSVTSEYARFYVAALRKALQSTQDAGDP